jgi:uncharacterized membrane protein YtjA (UPF0391 family)
MFNWGIAFLVIAIVAGVLGFGGIAGASAGLAKITLIAGLVLAFALWILGKKAPPK